MPLDHILVLAGVTLFSSAAGVMIGTRAEQRRLMRQLTEEAQEWLDQRSSN